MTVRGHMSHVCVCKVLPGMSAYWTLHDTAGTLITLADSVVSEQGWIIVLAAQLPSVVVGHLQSQSLHASEAHVMVTWPVYTPVLHC